MASRILVDTSVLIDLQLGVKKTIQLFDTYQKQIVISRITACEFIYGSRDKGEKKINKDFLESLRIVEITSEVSSYSYFLLDKYGLKTKFGIADALIAATAIVNDLPLWSLNQKHFSKIKELKLFNP